MEKVTVEFSAEEITALRALAKKSHCTLEEVVAKETLVGLINKGLINESAERNGWRVTRLDE